MSEYDRSESSRDGNDFDPREAADPTRGGDGDDEHTTVLPTFHGEGVGAAGRSSGAAEVRGDGDEERSFPGGATADERAAAAAGYAGPYSAPDSDDDRAPRFSQASYQSPSPYGQNPGGQGPSGQGSYGPDRYGQGPYGDRAPGPTYGQQEYGQAYGQQAYGTQQAYGQQSSYGQPGAGRPATGQPGYREGQRVQGQYGDSRYGPGQYSEAQNRQGQYGQTQNRQGGYGEPPRGGSTATFAPWTTGPGGPGDQGRRRRGGYGILAAAGVLAILLGGGAGLAAAELADNGNTTVAAPVASSAAAPQPTVGAVTGGGDSAVEQVANSALPSVVAITVLNGQTGDTGSGVILSADGLILTNNHVIAAGATGGTITVSFNDGTNVKAAIVGRDPVTDLAVLKVAGKTGLKAATLGNSDAVEVGQTVVAVGSPLGLNGTVTTGIISALNRPVTSSGETSTDQTTTVNAMQTDAPINPGNSGGPLLNLSGQVIGINSSIAALPSSSDSQSGSIGLGFAIPINQITPIVKELETTGKATHAQLGVTVQDNQDTATGLTTGALLKTVVAGKSAALAGLKVGDVITGVQGRPITSSSSLVATIHSYRPGNKISVTFLRAGTSHVVEVTLDSDS